MSPHDGSHFCREEVRGEREKGGDRESLSLSFHFLYLIYLFIYFIYTKNIFHVFNF